MLRPKGIINVNKHKGVTSFYIVDAVKKLLNVTKVGHGGTLDPMAEGVLLVLLGDATKIQAYLPDEKEYEGIMELGKITSTQDITGEILTCSDPGKIDEKDIASSGKNFLGETDQIPPMVSAKHFNGKRLYKLHREGKEVDRLPQKVYIKSLEIISYAPPNVYFKVICSSGTYVRTLVHDWGQRLGCGACLSALKRTRIGDFHIKDSVPIASGRQELLDNLKPIEVGISSLGRVVVKDGAVKKIVNGSNIMDSWIQHLDPAAKGKDVYAVYGFDRSLLALARYVAGNWSTLRVFLQE